MKKLVVTEVPSTKPRQRRQWKINLRDTGGFVTHPYEYPEFAACLAFDGRPMHDFYVGPISFYRPDQDAPYLTITSPILVASYDGKGITPKQMLRLFGGEVIQLNPQVDQLAF
jgi:hypothetical protein